MLHHSEQRFVPYEPIILYDIVLDVQHYADFLPWCTLSRVITAKNGSPSGHMSAELIVGYKAIHEKFTSHITYNDEQLTINTRGIKGVLKDMNSAWQFTHHDGGCMIDFSVSLSFQNIMLERLFASLFNKAIARMAQSFDERANLLYAANN